MNKREEKQGRVRFERVYGRKPNSLEWEQYKKSYRPPSEKSMNFIKIKGDFPSPWRQDQKTKVRLIQVKRMENAKKWFKEQENPFNGKKDKEFKDERARIIIFLKEERGLQFKEIAKVVGKDLATVSWIYRRYKG